MAPSPSPSLSPIGKQIPASLSKYFKTTAKAQRLMDPEGRICELDRKSRNSELVFSKHPDYPGVEGTDWDEINWSQRVLWEATQKDSSIRLSRKSPFGILPGGPFTIYARDTFNTNNAETALLSSECDHNIALTTIRLGYAQCTREWIYILTRKRAEKFTKTTRFEDSDKYEGYEMLARRWEDSGMGMGTIDGRRPGRFDGAAGMRKGQELTDDGTVSSREYESAEVMLARSNERLTGPEEFWKGG